MTEQELKQEQAAFKTWYVNRLCKAGTWRIRVAEISTGLRFAVEKDGKLEELWCRDGKEYKRII